jgi:hypothetical protein
MHLQAQGIENAYQESRFELEDCEWDVRKAAEKLSQSLSRSDGPSTDPQLAKYIHTLEESVANFTFADLLLGNTVAL